MGKSSKSEKVDKAVGTWVGSAISANGSTQYIQFQVLKDGSIVFNSTIDVQQPFGEFSYGAYLTIGQGYWKRLKCKKYATRQTQALVAKDLTPTENHKGIPIGRLVVDSKFTISNNCLELDGSFKVKFYELDDIHFQNPKFVNAGTYKMGKLPLL